MGFWDPLGFSSDGIAERFRRRQTELKHVGISMLATFCYIALEITGFNFLADALNGLDEGAALPVLLAKVPRGVPRRDGKVFFYIFGDEYVRGGIGTALGVSVRT